MIDIDEIKAYGAWSGLMEQFREQLRASPEVNALGIALCDEHECEMCDGILRDKPGVQRFRARKHGATAGWMILQTGTRSVKVVSIVIDQDPQMKSGVLVALIQHAVHQSMRAGFAGFLTLSPSVMQPQRGAADSLEDAETPEAPA